MPGFKTTVGHVEMVSLTDGHGALRPVEVFPESSVEQWRSEYPELLDQDELVHSRYGSVAVRSRGKLIIVDTGLRAEDGTLLKDMAAKGVDRDAVALVVMTHLHRDHVGWNLSDGRPTFPKARYLIPRADWEFWTQPSIADKQEHLRSQVLPLRDLNVLDLIEGEYEITAELRAVATPGHTPGHTSVKIDSAGQRGFILGDVAHSPVQAHYTRWNPGGDIDHIQSRKTRSEVIARLEAEGAMVSAGHFPDPGFGRFVRRDGWRIWKGI